MSESTLRALVERINADTGFAALMASDPEAALAGQDLTEAERRRLLDIGADAAEGVQRLETRVSRSSLVFGSLGHGAAHESMTAAHADTGSLYGAHADAHSVSAIPDLNPDPGAPVGNPGINIYEGAPVGAGGWHLPAPDPYHQPVEGWPGHVAPHGDAAAASPADSGADPATHQGWDSAWSQHDAGGHGSGIWQLPGSGDQGSAVDHAPIEGIGREVERIPILGEAFSAGEALVARGHSVPADVLDTFTSLGGSVVTSMETAVTTSITDGIGAGEQVAHRFSSIRW